ncbi:hypothetical protein L596_028089 [Steinernema carpocapsae]|uniref:Uncharacterized protein n=1 Tax=Steinernema carpocapsae TaxID=34508 RepID=A0A4U5LXE1_STECR|nr:hypothetical protein L596_028089 [Steinernema carpocapsae]
MIDHSRAHISNDIVEVQVQRGWNQPLDSRNWTQARSRGASEFNRNINCKDETATVFSPRFRYEIKCFMTTTLSGCFPRMPICMVRLADASAAAGCVL